MAKNFTPARSLNMTGYWNPSAMMKKNLPLGGEKVTKRIGLINAVADVPEQAALAYIDKYLSIQVIT